MSGLADPAQCVVALHAQALSALAFDPSLNGAGGVAEYRATEGKETLLDYRGRVGNTLQEILGGMRSACTYVGARGLKEFSKRTTFIRVARR